ncbi:ABC transporter substrate-binding protein [Lichenibacterium dinghuense]|uniref:ABC transporter substrate-binding protein n=1 Tax=Lichenibacterium dinghuense TaxID=2895977 RepID=UPI001F42CD05|nr:ABC transporter substrate-binding protein [Lichenibacterium sp. 6Y81]
MRGAELTRRGALLSLAAVLAGPAWAAAAAPPAPRVASLDWTLASACLSLGLVPAGVAETRAYGRWVVEPALPAGTVELGVREAPSLEGLAQLAPDLILVNGFHDALRARLERIAPTLSIDIYGDGRRPLAAAEDALRALGRRFGLDAEADAVVGGVDAGFARARAALGAAARPPVLPFNLADGRTLRLYGAGSLYADALERIGLASAWAGTTSPWGTATADFAALAAVPDATLVLVEPVPAEAEAVLTGGALWAGLVAGRRLVRLPAVWPFGEASAALRFAALLAAALTRGESSRDGRSADAR